MSSDTESILSSDTLVDDDDGSSTEYSDDENEPPPPTRLHTLEYPLLIVRARRRLHPASAFDPVSRQFQDPSGDTEAPARIFNTRARVTSRECYLTRAGDTECRAADEPAIASCWLEAPDDGTEMKFIEALCEVREAALRAGDEVEMSQLLWTPPGYRSVLLQVGWLLRSRNGESRADELPIFDSEDRLNPPTSLAGMPIGRTVHVLFHLRCDPPTSGEKPMVGAQLLCMKLL